MQYSDTTYGRSAQHTTTTPPPSHSYSPADARAAAQKACEANDAALLDAALARVATEDMDAFLAAALSALIPANALPMLNHLVDNYGVHLRNLQAATAASTPFASTKTLEFLLAHGWDINNWRAGGASYTAFLWYVVADEALVRWSLEHGARVKNVHVYNRPLLESVARRGSLATFKMLRAKGAPLPTRALHLAVEAAAVGHNGADDKEKDSAEQRRSRAAYEDRMALVRYLVDELRLDVNALDWVPGDKGFSGGGSDGSPMSYVVAHYDPKLTRRQRELVWFLLDRGADPTTALADAEEFGLPLFVQYVSEWREQRDRTRAGRSWSAAWTSRGCGVQ